MVGVGETFDLRIDNRPFQSLNMVEGFDKRKTHNPLVSQRPQQLQEHRFSGTSMPAPTQNFREKGWEEVKNAYEYAALSRALVSHHLP